MARHESHERKCPTCNEWMSATAPRCLNCGEYVDDDDEHEPMEKTASGAGVYWIVGGAAVVVTVIAAMALFG